MARTKKDPAGVGAIPKNELRWVSAYDDKNNLKYVITSNPERTWYYIYDGNLKKLGKGQSPLGLREKYFGDE